jgi:hypothetical protein
MDISHLEKIIQESTLSSDEARRLYEAIQKQGLQEQVFLFQIFEKYPEKIPAFWEVSKKKFEFLKDGVGDMDAILKEEIELFS